MLTCHTAQWATATENMADTFYTSLGKTPWTAYRY